MATTVEARPHKTAAQRLAQIFGWLFIVIALAGFAATGASMETDHDLAPRLLGVFPVNVAHNIAHGLIGLWGLAASRGFGASKVYLYGAGIVYLVLASLGAVAPNGFGLMPLGGADVGLHAVLALVLLLAAFATTRRAPERAVGA